MASGNLHENCPKSASAKTKIYMTRAFCLVSIAPQIPHVIPAAKHRDVNGPRSSQTGYYKTDTRPVNSPVAQAMP